VERIQGSHECRKWSVKDRNEDPSFEKGYEEEVVAAEFVLVPAPDSYFGNRYWITEEASLSGHQSLTQEDRDTWRQSRMTSQGAFGGTEARDLQFDINTTEGTWTFSTGGDLGTPYTVKSTYYLRENRDGKWVAETRTETESEARYAHSVISGDLPVGKPRAVSGATVRSEEMPDYWVTNYQDCRVWLTPEIVDFEVVVTIPGYETWRPLGSLKNPAVSGNSLRAVAVLRPKGPPPGRMPKVTAFRFELQHTSREPGVCMNWPNGAGGRRDGRAEKEGMYEGVPKAAVDRGPDLRLAVDEKTPGEVGEEGQFLEVRRPQRSAEGHPFAAARVDSFDFGGRTDLLVTCELEDGRVIVGALADTPSRVGPILLPRRAPAGWIAASWLDANNLGGKTDWDDGEEEPEGDGTPGDGFTLYEEYRGFAVGGERVAGDPKRKDFFVQNQMGAAAQGGIDLFAQLTGLTVHDKLTDREMYFMDRIMNGNRREAPHLVDQHGVFIVEDGGVSGAQASFWDGTGRGRPGLTKGISVNVHDVLFQLQFTMVPEADGARAVDRAIAHELLHTVGVEHHGQGAEHRTFYLRPPGHPENPTDRPVLTWGGSVVRVLLEDTRQDLAELLASGWRPSRKGGLEPEWRGDIEARRKRMEEDKASEIEVLVRSWGRTPEEAARQYDEQGRGDPFFHETFVVGVPGDEHSGDDQCVMRYYFADLYEVNGSEDLYHVVPAGTEPAGLALCTGATGTGINDASRGEDDRYGDATNGACAGRVRVNDAARP
jgi:hypothetical protein